MPAPPAACEAKGVQDMYQNTKLCSVISYITWIGWFVALVIRDKRDELVRHHLNQALVLNIISIVSGFLAKRSIFLLSAAGSIISLGVFVFAIMGIIRAVNLSDEPLPLIGSIRLL